MNHHHQHKHSRALQHGGVWPFTKDADKDTAKAEGKKRRDDAKEAATTQKAAAKAQAAAKARADQLLSYSNPEAHKTQKQSEKRAAQDAKAKEAQATSKAKGTAKDARKAYFAGQTSGISKAGDYLSRKTSGLGKTISGPSALKYSNIFQYFTKALYIAGIILIIIGVISLPILIIMILTYLTLKMVVSRITAL